MPNENQKLEKQLHFLREWTVTTTIIFCNDHFQLLSTTLNLLGDVVKVRREDGGRVFLFWRTVSLQNHHGEINILLILGGKAINAVNFSSC